eukprot:9191600-Pyramimonas_sp.AAC.2
MCFTSAEFSSSLRPAATWFSSCVAALSRKPFNMPEMLSMNAVFLLAKLGGVEGTGVPPATSAPCMCACTSGGMSTSCDCAGTGPHTASSVLSFQWRFPGSWTFD